jgi:hypothetical protein
LPLGKLNGKMPVSKNEVYEMEINQQSWKGAVLHFNSKFLLAPMGILPPESAQD